MHKYVREHPILTRLQDTTFVNRNYWDHQRRIKLFKSNTVYIISSEGIAIRKFFRLLNQLGIKISREGWIHGKRETNPNTLIITTFANLLDVEPGILFSEDIARDYIPLKDRQTSPQ